MPKKQMIDNSQTHDTYSGQNEPKKRGRKSKKQNEKEILHALFVETQQIQEDISEDPTPEKPSDQSEYMKRNYENFAFLSAKERALFEKKFTVPKNPHQQKYTDLLKTKQNKIVIANGPAGTGKTLFATEFGVRYFLTNTYEKLIFTRPSVSVDEELGFLPGTLEEKMAPWVRPIYDILYQFLTPKEVQQLMDEKVIEIAPLGYMRGRTFKNAWIVADEMQNSTISQMKMLLTRLGENSRLVVTGDLQQFDRAYEQNGLDDFMRKYKYVANAAAANNDIRPSNSIQIFEFEKSDIQRENVVKEVLDIYDYCG
jgi:phosphate starvation-inducible PhoH-like protein